MEIKAFEPEEDHLGDEMQLRKITYILHPALWETNTFLGQLTKLTNWKTIKYLNSNADDFSSAVDSIPKDKGGLYIFMIQSQVVEGLTEFPCYIGRARSTKKQNLNKRIKEYFTHFKNGDLDRPKIRRLFKFWKEHLYVAYCALDNNEEIEKSEVKLINSLIFPFNEAIPEKRISQQRKAFQ